MLKLWFNAIEHFVDSWFRLFVCFNDFWLCAPLWFWRPFWCLMIVNLSTILRILGVFPLLRIPDFRLCLRNLLVLVMVVLLTFLLTDQGLVHRFDWLWSRYYTFMWLSGCLNYLEWFFPCCLLSLLGIQDLKKKEKELQAKEAELRRREQVKLKLKQYPLKLTFTVPEENSFCWNFFD